MQEDERQRVTERGEAASRPGAATVRSDRAAERSDPFARAVERVEARERIASRVKLVGTLQLVLGGVGLLVAGLVGGVVGSLGLAVGGAESGPWLGTLGAVLGGFGAALSLPALVGGIGLIRGRAWARRLVVVLAALELFYVPLGTILGGATLLALLPEPVRRYFEGESALD